MQQKGEEAMAVSLKQPFSESPAYRWLIFGTVVIGTFMVNVDSSIVNVALPILQEQYKVSTGILQWVISGYLLVITAILPVIGGISDRVDRKKMFIAGVSVFTLGSILCGTAAGIEQLILYRLIQALGGAVIMGNVMSIVAYTFPAGQRGRPLGLISSVVAIGTIVGPAVGGLLIASAGWRSIFWVNAPFGVISVLMSIFVLRRISSNKNMAEFDWIGSGWFILAMMSLLLFISNGTDWGWLSLWSVGSLVVSILSWFWFVRRSLHIKMPLIELSLFRSARFTIGNFAGYLSYVMIMFPAILLPLFLRQVLHEPIGSIGLLLTPQSIVMIVFAPLGGWLSDRIGPRWPTVAGMALTAGALGLMALLGRGSSYGEIVLDQALFGAGLGLFTSPNNVVVLESVPVEKTGLTGSLLATVRNFGRVTGVAFAVLLLETQVGSRAVYPTAMFLRGFHLVFVAGLLLGVLGTVMVSLRGSVPSQQESLHPSRS